MTSTVKWSRPTFFCQHFRKHQWRPFDPMTGKHVGPYWDKPCFRRGSKTQDRWATDLDPRYNWCCLRCGQWARLADERIIAIKSIENGGPFTDAGQLSEPVTIASKLQYELLGYHD